MAEGLNREAAKAAAERTEELARCVERNLAVLDKFCARFALLDPGAESLTQRETSVVVTLLWQTVRLQQQIILMNARMRDLNSGAILQALERSAWDDDGDGWKRGMRPDGSEVDETGAGD